MDQERVGNFIKEIRKRQNLTQKELAQILGVTYQAVSKWERGLNMPDISLIHQMSKEFHISFDEFFEGEYKPKGNKKRIVVIGIIVILFLIFASFLFFQNFYKEKDFEFKTLSTKCDDFTISGTIAYNEKKSSIYITNIKYCGEEEKLEYQKIECVLYEKNEDTEKRISSYEYDKKKTTTLTEFLKEVTLSIDNYEKTCKEYEDGNLYLLINATDPLEKIRTYRIPLKLDSCSK